MASHIPFRLLAALLIGSMCTVGCRKEVKLIEGNVAPHYDGVSSVQVRNYVNRLFIDLIGREPLDVEMDARVSYLRAHDLSMAARQQVVGMLMTGADPIAGDSSYRHAYYRRQYELYKARCLEGASDEVIDGFIANAAQAALADSLSGNAQGLTESQSELQKLLRLKAVQVDYREGSIGIAEVMKRMVFNAVYDEIHMNSFNFINATFDNLLFRYPTGTEFNAAYAMVEQDQPAILFGQGGQNKAEYATILTGSTECHEGLIRWCYLTFLGREPSTYEAYQATTALMADGDFQRAQRDILTSDEYAGFGDPL